NNEQPNNEQEPNQNENNGETVTSSEPNKYDLSKTIDENNVVTNSSDLEVVVNKKRYLPEDYVPEDLVPLDDLPTVLENPEINQLRKVAHDALKLLFDSAKEDGYELKARSGYRSYNTQSSLYKSYVASNGQEAADKYSAKPGQSEHQTGLAIDITAASMNFQLDDTFENTEEGKWVKDNAHKYGFIVRYPKGKESITGYSFEPWHLRYVGVELAKEVFESGFTLEEYFESKAQ
ncbi:MAG: family metallopeptidase, partial [Bacillota bacterium]|nr:family metallopeptidase [Bacillota bacterium]